MTPNKWYLSLHTNKEQIWYKQVGWWVKSKIPQLLWLLSSGAGWSELSLLTVVPWWTATLLQKIFVPWNWIVLLCDRRRTVFVDACVNTHCRGCDVVFLSLEQDPSVRDSHHHGQTAHWIWGIWGEVWCVCVCLCFISFPGNKTKTGKTVATLYYHQGLEP